jgi:hypothetical protein
MHGFLGLIFNYSPAKLGKLFEKSQILKLKIPIVLFPPYKMFRRLTKFFKSIVQTPLKSSIKPVDAISCKKDIAERRKNFLSNHETFMQIGSVKKLIGKLASQSLCSNQL